MLCHHALHFHSYCSNQQSPNHRAPGTPELFGYQGLYPCDSASITPLNPFILSMQNLQPAAYTRPTAYIEGTRWATGSAMLSDHTPERGTKPDVLLSIYVLITAIYLL